MSFIIRSAMSAAAVARLNFKHAADIFSNRARSFSNSSTSAVIDCPSAIESAAPLSTAFY